MPARKSTTRIVPANGGQPTGATAKPAAKPAARKPAAKPATTKLLRSPRRSPLGSRCSRCRSVPSGLPRDGVIRQRQATSTSAWCAGSGSPAGSPSRRASRPWRARSGRRRARRPDQEPPGASPPGALSRRLPRRWAGLAGSAPGRRSVICVRLPKVSEERPEQRVSGASHGLLVAVALPVVTEEVHGMADKKPDRHRCYEDQLVHSMAASWRAAA